ncbi:MAG: TetR/AcrR family transcriptional regulator [Pseudomonadota bacterium]
MSFLKPRSTETTRDRLMTVAELAILEKGFAATSIEEVIAEVGITKSGFFYHFQDKRALVKAILERQLIVEETWFDGLFRRAADDDPLQEVLNFLDLLKADMENLPEIHPGCLISATCFQERLFDHEIHDLACENLLGWRRRMHAKFRAVARIYPPKIDINLETLADMMTTVTDGAIILSKTVRQKEVLPRQIGLYRAFVQQVFT